MQHTYPTAYMNAANSITMVERDLLPLDDAEVLVRTHQASICDADLRRYQGHETPKDLPNIPYWVGHEGGGEIIAVGPKVREFAVGDRVMLFGPHASFANVFKAHVNSLERVPEGADMDIACLGEPTAVGLFAVVNSGTIIGDTAVVVGLNYQGQVAVQGLRAMGASRVVVVDYNDFHLDVATSRGADIALNSERTDVRKEILELTGGVGADVVFHSCGYWNPHAEEYFGIALDVVRDEGCVSSVPDIVSRINVALHRVHHHGLDLRFPALMHHGYEFRRRWVQRLMRPAFDGIISVKDLITAEFPLGQAHTAMNLFNEDLDQIKIVLKP